MGDSTDVHHRETYPSGDACMQQGRKLQTFEATANLASSAVELLKLTPAVVSSTRADSPSRIGNRPEGIYANSLAIIGLARVELIGSAVCRQAQADQRLVVKTLRGLKGRPHLTIQKH